MNWPKKAGLYCQGCCGRCSGVLFGVITKKTKLKCYKILQSQPFKSNNPNVFRYLHLTFPTVIPIRESSAVSHHRDYPLGVKDRLDTGESMCLYVADLIV